MKITNLDKGKTYQLGEGAKLEVERTNPFFNDYGETTTPLDIPASDYNRMILGYPDTFGLREKMVAANVSIEDGEYFAQCRQIVLSAQHKGNISSSFYINDGSFYSKIQNVKLKSIFKDEMIPGCSTLDECISSAGRSSAERTRTTISSLCCSPMTRARIPATTTRS